VLLFGGGVVLDGGVPVPVLLPAGVIGGEPAGVFTFVPCDCPALLSGEVVVPGTLGCVTDAGCDGCDVVVGEATLAGDEVEFGMVVVVLAAPAAPEIPPAAAGVAPAGATFCPMAVPLTTSSTRRFS
jgi:hypothetical protein